MKKKHYQKLTKIALSGVMAAGMFATAGISTHAAEPVNEPNRAIEGPGQAGNITLINEYIVDAKYIAWGTSAALVLLARKFPDALSASTIAGIILNYPGYQEFKIATQTYRDGYDYETFNRIVIYDENWNYVGAYNER
jgi:hypothetical protein